MVRYDIIQNNKIDGVSFKSIFSDNLIRINHLVKSPTATSPQQYELLQIYMFPNVTELKFLKDITSQVYPLNSRFEYALVQRPIRYGDVMVADGAKQFTQTEFPSDGVRHPMIIEGIGVHYKMVLADIKSDSSELKFATLEWQIYNKNGTINTDMGGLKYSSNTITGKNI